MTDKTKIGQPDTGVARPLRHVVASPTLGKLVEMLRPRVFRRADVVVEGHEKYLATSKNPQMKEVMEQVRQVAQSDFSVIIQGETGTGKSVVARTLHELSRRSGKPFVTVDLSAVPETLVESALFGYEKGAFTGANKRTPGLFSTANGGTVFIDELQDIHERIQRKLLHVVEEREMYLVGNPKPVGIDVRIISATNADIKKNVKERKFREDLFYRLGEYLIDLPPLRQRPEDITALANIFMEETCKHLGCGLKTFSGDAMETMTRHSWPGNIRELKNVVKRASVTCQDCRIDTRHLDLFTCADSENVETCTAVSLKDISKNAVRDAETGAIREALRLNGNNKRKTAAMLQVDYKTLLTKIKEYGL
jgi:DNA-binding NtrC family response regulator